jgi:hypothetical protein
MPDAKSFDFVVESSFVECYSEDCFDLFQKGDAVGVMLPVGYPCTCRPQASN